MDHDRYGWSALFDRAPVRWPGNARVALLVVPVLQWFPLDTPATPHQPVGALDPPYPDYRAYTHRDYGNRVGIFRVMAVLDRLGLPATAAVNAAVAARYPRVLDEIGGRRWEIAAHGLHMGRFHHGGLDRHEEATIVDEALGPPPARQRAAGPGVALPRRRGIAPHARPPRRAGRELRPRLGER